MRIRGRGGEVRVGYQVAATLGDWTLTRTRLGPAPEYQAEAQLASCDTYWTQQRPMDVDLKMGNRRWQWSGVHPAIDQQSLAVVLVGTPAIH